MPGRAVRGHNGRVARPCTSSATVPWLRPLRLVAALSTAAVACLETPAHAFESETSRDNGASDDRTPAIVWDLRLNGGVGWAGGVGSGPAWRAGLDAEYWLRKNIGFGIQLGYQTWTTFDLCAGDCSSARGDRFSIAPSLTVRGNNPANFPIVGLAFGAAWGHAQSASWCDYDPVCPGTFSAQGNTWGPYASLTLGWVFHPGTLGPGEGALAIGPMVRAELFSGSWGDSSGAFSLGGSFITGMTLGFGATGRAPP